MNRDHELFRSVSVDLADGGSFLNRMAERSFVDPGSHLRTPAVQSVNLTDGKLKVNSRDKNKKTTLVVGAKRKAPRILGNNNVIRENEILRKIEDIVKFNRNAKQQQQPGANPPTYLTIGPVKSLRQSDRVNLAIKGIDKITGNIRPSDQTRPNAPLHSCDNRLISYDSASPYSNPIPQPYYESTDLGSCDTRNYRIKKERISFNKSFDAAPKTRPKKSTNPQPSHFTRRPDQPLYNNMIRTKRRNSNSNAVKDLSKIQNTGRIADKTIKLVRKDRDCVGNGGNFFGGSEYKESLIGNLVGKRSCDLGERRSG